MSCYTDPRNDAPCSNLNVMLFEAQRKFQVAKRNTRVSVQRGLSSCARDEARWTCYWSRRIREISELKAYLES